MAPDAEAPFGPRPLKPSASAGAWSRSMFSNFKAFTPAAQLAHGGPNCREETHNLHIYIYLSIYEHIYTRYVHIYIYIYYDIIYRKREREKQMDREGEREMDRETERGG